MIIRREKERDRMANRYDWNPDSNESDEYRWANRSEHAEWRRLLHDADKRLEGVEGADQIKQDLPKFDVGVLRELLFEPYTLMGEKRYPIRRADRDAITESPTQQMQKEKVAKNYPDPAYAYQDTIVAERMFNNWLDYYQHPVGMASAYNELNNNDEWKDKSLDDYISAQFRDFSERWRLGGEGDLKKYAPQIVKYIRNYFKR